MSEFGLQKYKKFLKNSNYRNKKHYKT